MFGSSVSSGSVSSGSMSSGRWRERWRLLVGLVAILSIASSTSWATMNSDNDDGDGVAEPAVVAIQAEPEAEIDWGFMGLSLLDAVVLRPIGAMTTAGGFVIFLVAAPFVAPSGHLGTAWDVFVYGAYDETFVRPLGEI